MPTFATKMSNYDLMAEGLSGHFLLSQVCLDCSTVHACSVLDGYVTSLYLSQIVCGVC